MSHRASGGTAPAARAHLGFHGFFSRLVDDRVTILLQLNLGPRLGAPDELRPHVETVVEMVLAAD